MSIGTSKSVIYILPHNLEASSELSPQSSVLSQVQPFKIYKVVHHLFIYCNMNVESIQDIQDILLKVKSGITRMQILCFKKLTY